MESAVGIIFPFFFSSKTIAEAIYKFASHQAIPNGHSTKLTHTHETPTQIA